MWLINCRTFELEEVLDHKDQTYAVLSHTWHKGEEVQHSEFQNRRAIRSPRWQKIEKTCQLALDDGYSFAWVDTCCIDKKNAAELTEAINSMFSWYNGSEVCYVYLADYDASDPTAELGDSRWFRRGWTLQELIAPARVHFFDRSWKPVGTKDSLSEQLALITGIGHEILTSEHRCLQESLDQVPIARRMSWAANRETTRNEDTAYCLVGLFGVNLPFLYGEGERAFIRLQEEIIKNSNDLSLLAWLYQTDRTTADRDSYCGVFARHPRDFHASDKLALIDDLKFMPEFTISNKGLKMCTELHYDYSQGLHILELNCFDVTSPQKKLGIFLKHQGASIFARAKPHLFASQDTVDCIAVESKSFFLSKSITPTIASSLHKAHRCSFVVRKIKRNWRLTAVEPDTLWDDKREMFITAGLQDFVGCHEYTTLGNKASSHSPISFIVLFGFGYGFAPWVHILHSTNMSRSDIMRGWKVFAEFENGKTSRYLSRHAVPLLGISILYVTLEPGVQDGEPVYLVQIKSGSELANED
ncbi:MAG: hypothetical protein Q9190_001326 [Brigantiaea leucoxantha]